MAAMEQPTPILALIGAAGLMVVGGGFVVGFTVATQQLPEAPVGAVNVSPAAQQPAKDAEGNPLPVQPGEPEENQPIANAPATNQQAGVQPERTPPGAAPAAPPAAASTAPPGQARDVPLTTPPAQEEGDGSGQ